MDNDKKMNHKWNKDNVCLKCHIHRELRYFSALMAVVNHPPWEAYKREMKYVYWTPGDKDYTTNRPDCKNIKLTN